MKEWIIAHSAKGSTWAKHKYIKKVGNRYIYAKGLSGNTLSGKTAANKLGSEYNYRTNMSYYSPGTKTPVIVNTFGKNRGFYKVGGKYYHQDDINAANAKMDAADKYNQSMKNVGFRNGLKAKGEYEKSVKSANEFRKNSKDSNDVFNKITLAALNTKEGISKAAKKGKSLISKLFGR